MPAQTGLRGTQITIREAVIGVLEAVERASGPSGDLLDVGVNHGGLQASMPEQQLYGPNVSAVVEKMCRERVP